VPPDFGDERVFVVRACLEPALAPQRLAHRIASRGRLLIGPPGSGSHLLAPDTATLGKRC
jgi:hypothetical protein